MQKYADLDLLRGGKRKCGVAGQSRSKRKGREEKPCAENRVVQEIMRSQGPGGGKYEKAIDILKSGENSAGTGETSEIFDGRRS